jgi:hypothetical protein
MLWKLYAKGPVEIRRAFSVRKIKMSKQKQDNRTVRECTTKWDYNEGDELKTCDVRVFYFSPTIAQLKAARVKDEAAKEQLWLSDSLADQLHSLLDLPSSIEQPAIPPTVAWLDEQDLVNLKRVKAAIEEDLDAGK